MPCGPSCSGMPAPSTNGTSAPWSGCSIPKRRSRAHAASSPWRTGWRPCVPPATFPTSMHMIGEPLITLEEGSAEATVDTYAVVYQLGHEGSGDLTLGIRYLDDVVLHEGRWLFLRRNSHTVWTR